MKNIIDNQSNKQNNKKGVSTKDVTNNLTIMANNIFSFPKIIYFALGLFPIAVVAHWVASLELLKPFNEPFNAILGAFGISTNTQPISMFAAIIAALIMLAVLAYGLSSPMKRKSWQNVFNELKFPDYTGENTPILIKEKCINSEAEIYEAHFIKNGTLLGDLQDPDNCERIGSKKGCSIVNVEPVGGRNNRVKVTYRKSLDYQTLYWNTEKHLQKEDFVLALGQKSDGTLKTANLNQYAHMIIAGSTGSGKSVLLSCLLAQSWLKGAKVTIAELAKYGVDWSNWKNLDNCRVITEVTDFADYLKQTISGEMWKRANLLLEHNCKNIAEYNTKIDSGEVTGKKLDHIVIALDEAGQVYTKSSNKERETYLSEIRGTLDTLVTTARFVGIHVFFATQVPSSKILSEEVRHLTDLKVCGISNSTLSDVAIGNDLAARIPKTRKGFFHTSEDRTENDGFQGFLINEEDVLKK